MCGLIVGVVWYQQKTINQYANETQDSGDDFFNFEKQKGNQLTLCVKCFTEGKIPDIYSSNDFHKVDLLSKINPNNIKNANSGWSQEETLKLLDLIQKHQDNWKEIQRHFPNKSRDEIIMHYFQLPANNITSLNIFDHGDDRAEELTPAERIYDNTPTVFSDYSNPIL